MIGTIVQKGTPNEALGRVVKTSDGNEWAMKPYDDSLLPGAKVRGTIQDGFFVVSS